MSIRLHNIHLPLDHAEGAAEAAALRWLGVRPAEVRSVRIRRRSVDARRGRPIRFVYQVEVDVRGDETAALGPGVRRRRDRKITARIVPAGRPEPPAPGTESLRGPVVVVGAGPCGLFAAHRLAERGFLPVVLDRGKPAEQRMKDLRRFRLFGDLDPESNLLFGEGGAGMFSDGKLTTRNRSPLIDEVLEIFHRSGAPDSILVEARPHIGSNFLPRVLPRLRTHLTARGAAFRFETRVTGFEVKEGRLTALRIGEERLEVGAAILGTGGSARDVFKRLGAAGAALEARPTLVGVRVEHPQDLIDANQYGAAAGDARLGSAEYFLTLRASEADGLRRPVHSFCMCPGGEVVAVATEAGGV